MNRMNGECDGRQDNGQEHYPHEVGPGDSTAQDHRGQDGAEEGRKNGDDDSAAVPGGGQPDDRKDEEVAQHGKVLIRRPAGESNGQAVQDRDDKHCPSRQPFPRHKKAADE
ncbi:hypothetical protein [Arthrobacter sp. 9AX]|uniref:hypothetical protein n=1 Tax=Arthrobacter sp. 9AX TaxID=2653131 RepID=UPI001F2DC92A|nr:hypothetical protein [Arthrobacter sp. 9AX]